ncbi:MAG: hypothetical protein ACLR4Z_03695 [Butyricicoccaceae bacterium]
MVLCPKPNGILAMNPEKYREIDGVVFDEASYARHCQPPEPERSTQIAETAARSKRAGTVCRASTCFRGGPLSRTGWYPADDERPPVPIMGGAVRSTAGAKATSSAMHGVNYRYTDAYCVPCGSGSGSYVTPYTTSYTARAIPLVRFGFGPVPVFRLVLYTIGGYGLELI